MPRYFAEQILLQKNPQNLRHNLRHKCDRILVGSGQVFRFNLRQGARHFEGELFNLFWISEVHLGPARE